MNWAECSRHQEWTGIRNRFSWPSDGLAGFNCEAGTTVSDIWGAVAWLWTYPGDWLLRLPSVNKFLELEPLHTGGWASGLVPLVAWVVIIVVAEAVMGR